MCVVVVCTRLCVRLRVYVFVYAYLSCSFGRVATCLCVFIGVVVVCDRACSCVYVCLLVC